jgi:hypothetical protein
MPRWSDEHEERVSPTARWIFRGVWTLVFVIFLVLLVGILVTLLVSALT